MPDPNPEPKTKSKTTDFSVDGEDFNTSEHDLTPRQILESYAHLDPSTHYLIWVHGRSQESFEGRPDDVIHVHEHQTFITASTGPTPVS
jgi:hypothetical protein